MAKKKLNKALLEASKEGMRVVLLAVLPVAIDSLSKGTLDYRLILTVGALALLRFVDSWLHQSGKAEKGLTRF